MVALVVGIVLIAAACSSKGYGTSASTTTTAQPASSGADRYGASASSSTTAASGSASTTDLAVAMTSVGNVVVDAKGHTLYLFMKDTSGTPTCTGACANAWPAATVSGTPTKSADIAGALTVTPTADGKSQLVLNGHPLYTYAADGAPGDVNGQGVAGVWFAVTAAGEKAG